MAACGSNSSSKKDSSSKPANDLVMKQAEVSPHGDMGFGVATVAMSGDKIVGAHLDEFQIVATSGKEAMKDAKGVPNSNSDFGKGVKAGSVLISKDENDAAYSAVMKVAGKATQSHGKSLDAIQSYVTGKTVAQLKKAIQDNKSNKTFVSGATLTDTAGYVQAFIDAATKGKTEAGIKNFKSTDKVKMGYALSAPHGTQSFGISTVAMVNGKVGAVYSDEFQFVAKSGKEALKGAISVPNSDKTFGKGFADGQTLISKETNDKAYSGLMKTIAKSTKDRAKSMNAIEAYTVGKSTDQILNGLTKDNATKTISGSTLADTFGYVNGIVDAAKAAK
ncbi:hypothetical protein EQG49_12520 [Periweissella cryptocerci]|uniref:Uncharacterized protein n=1 Tax=Periweissella cryptocerci TaxID=2506420 RepID=A0A4P6YWP1_9LACO|nr:hypothetical protein EQG49_12520 [Periweissella cryptocerci]